MDHEFTPAAPPEAAYKKGFDAGLAEAAEIICSECKRGDVPGELNDVITNNGRPFWHQLLHSDGTPSGTYTVCSAAAIHSRTGQSKGQLADT